MTEINNFEKIRGMLEFPDEDSFYFVQIIKRRSDKGNENMKRNATTIKSYFINNLEYFDRKKEEIIGLCKYFNARGTIRLNRRSYEKVGKDVNIRIAKLLSHGSYRSIIRAPESSCGSTIGKNVDKRWIIDIDVPYNEYELKIIKSELKKLQPIGDKVTDIIPSKSGYHLVTKPFNLNQLKELKLPIKINSEDVKKDSYTNLYINN